jgi:hypothetical protein
MTSYPKLPEKVKVEEPIELTDEELELVAGGVTLYGPQCGAAGKRCPVGYVCYFGGICGTTA